MKTKTMITPAMRMKVPELFSLTSLSTSNNYELSEFVSGLTGLGN